MPRIKSAQVVMQYGFVEVSASHEGCQRLDREMNMLCLMRRTEVKLPVSCRERVEIYICVMVEANIKDLI